MANDLRTDVRQFFVRMFIENYTGYRKYFAATYISAVAWQKKNKRHFEIFEFSATQACVMLGKSKQQANFCFYFFYKMRRIS